MPRIFDHIYILTTVVFTVYSQIIIRWQVDKAGELPVLFSEKLYFIFSLFLNPWVMSSILSTFIAWVSWMLALSRFEVSYAYPWVSMNFILILVLGVAFFGESYSYTKFFGTIFIMLGIIAVSKG